MQCFGIPSPGITRKQSLHVLFIGAYPSGKSYVWQRSHKKSARLVAKYREESGAHSQKVRLV